MTKLQKQTSTSGREKMNEKKTTISQNLTVIHSLRKYGILMTQLADEEA
jgi:hypothetical protein